MAKIVAGIFFVLFFFIFLIVASLRLEILNPPFIFNSFQRNNVYSNLAEDLAKALPNDPNLGKQAGQSYAKIVAKISPSKVQSILETNLTSILGFLNGNSTNINISVPASGLGISGAKDIKWSLSDSPSASGIQAFQGLGNKLIIAMVVLIILIFLLFLVAGRGILLFTGILVTILGVLAKGFLFVVTANTPAKEPAQVLLLTLSSSIFSDIAVTWVIVGTVLLAVYFLLRISSCRIAK